MAPNRFEHLLYFFITQNYRYHITDKNIQTSF